MTEEEFQERIARECPDEVCSGGWHCTLCVPTEHVTSEDKRFLVQVMVDHVRVMHPDMYGDGPERWPDGQFVILDSTLKPEDFNHPPKRV